MLSFSVESGSNRSAHQVALVRGATTRILVDGAEFDVQGRPCIDGAFEIRVGDRIARAQVVQKGDVAYVQVLGRTWKITVHDPVRESGSSEGQGLHCMAPMPGAIVDVKVKRGEQVSKGQTLVVIESMKMQVNLDAESDGIVEDVCYELGQTFDRDAVLVRLKAIQE